VKPESPTAAFADPPALPGGGRALLAGGLAAVLASACCLGPLVLVMLGVSGAWIGNLTLLEPFRPPLIGGAVIAMLLARRRIWRKTSACELGQVCALPRVNRAYKVVFWFLTALVVTALAFPLMVPLFY